MDRTEIYFLVFLLEKHPNRIRKRWGENSCKVLEDKESVGQIREDLKPLDRFQWRGELTNLNFLKMMVLISTLMHNQWADNLGIVTFQVVEINNKFCSNNNYMGKILFICKA